MRRSDNPTGAVWRLLSGWSYAHPLRPNQTQMARVFGVSTSLVSSWKYMQSAMQTDDMLRVAEATGIPFAEIATAVSEDSPIVTAYIRDRRVSEEPAARRSTKRPPKGSREQRAD